MDDSELFSEPETEWDVPASVEPSYEEPVVFEEPVAYQEPVMYEEPVAYEEAHSYDAMQYSDEAAAYGQYSATAGPIEDATRFLKRTVDDSVQRGVDDWNSTQRQVELDAQRNRDLVYGTDPTELIERTQQKVRDAMDKAAAPPVVLLPDP